VELFYVLELSLLSPLQLRCRPTLFSDAARISAGFNSVLRPIFRYGIRPRACSLRRNRRLIPDLGSGTRISMQRSEAKYPSIPSVDSNCSDIHRPACRQPRPRRGRGMYACIKSREKLPHVPVDGKRTCGFIFGAQGILKRGPVRPDRLISQNGSPDS
jgi:hypothetical protein